MSATGTEARVCADIAERQKMGGDRELLELVRLDIHAARQD